MPATMAPFTAGCRRDGCAATAPMVWDDDGPWYADLSPATAAVFRTPVRCSAPAGWVEHDGHLYCSDACARGVG